MTAAADLPEILTVTEAAAYARLSNSAIYRAVEEGIIPAARTSRGRKAAIRIHRDRLVEWLSGSAVA